jgi:hypothetical protein
VYQAAGKKPNVSSVESGPEHLGSICVCGAVHWVKLSEFWLKFKLFYFHKMIKNLGAKESSQGSENRGFLTTEVDMSPVIQTNRALCHRPSRHQICRILLSLTFVVSVLSCSSADGRLPVFLDCVNDGKLPYVTYSFDVLLGLQVGREWAPASKCTCK